MSAPLGRGIIRPWRFLDFVDPATTVNKIAQWLVGNPTLRARLTQELLYLGTLKENEWGTTYPFQWLTQKKYREAGLGKMRFECDGRAQRPVGRFGIGPRQFVLLMGCSKKGPDRPENYRPYPPNPFDVALARSAVYLANPTSVEERRITP